ncbi:MAG: O-antigen ligase family protein [Nitrospirae bacterium]|nr:O-antigen ligase family protein [Nitrospirota bacterium]
MKISSALESSLVGKIFLGFIIALFSYYVSFFIVDFAYEGIILLAVFCMGFIFLLSYPKTFIYFMIIAYPLLPLLWESTSIQLGGMRSLSVNIGGVLKVLGLIFGIFYLVINKADILKYKMSRPLIIFILISFVGIFFSISKMYSLRQWVNYALPAVFYFLILESIDNFSVARKLLKTALFFFFVPNFAIDLWRIFFYVPPAYIDPKEILALDAYPRFTGVNPNANIFGLELSIYMMLAIYFIFNLRHRNPYVFSFIGMFVMLFYSYSRSAWGAFFAALTLTGLFRFKKVYIAFMLAAVLIIGFIPPITDRFMSRLISESLVGPRKATIEYGMKLFRERPIFGYGPGGYETSQGSKYAGSVAYGVVGMDSHNEYITLLVEGGILFIGAYFYMIYRGYRLSLSIFRLPNKQESSYGVFLMSLIIIILMVGAGGHSYRHASFFLWVFMAIGEVCLREAEREKMGSGDIPLMSS